MPGWSTEIATVFIRRGLEHGRAFDQMQLQKLIYIAHGWSLAATGEPLTGDRPEAWDLGPISSPCWCTGAQRLRKGHGKHPRRRKHSNWIRIGHNRTRDHRSSSRTLWPLLVGSALLAHKGRRCAMGQRVSWRRRQVSRDPSPSDKRSICQTRPGNRKAPQLGSICFNSMILRSGHSFRRRLSKLLKGNIVSAGESVRRSLQVTLICCVSAEQSLSPDWQWHFPSSSLCCSCVFQRAHLRYAPPWLPRLSCQRWAS